MRHPPGRLDAYLRVRPAISIRLHHFVSLRVRVRVRVHAQAERCWIGLSDQQKKGDYEWADGAAGGVYRLWAHGEPNDAGGVEHCIYMHGRQYNRGDDAAVTKRRSWGDHPCGDKMEFVCEIPTDFRINTKRLDWQSAGGWVGE